MVVFPAASLVVIVLLLMAEATVLLPCTAFSTTTTSTPTIVQHRGDSLTILNRRVHRHLGGRGMMRGIHNLPPLRVQSEQQQNQQQDQQQSDVDNTTTSADDSKPTTAATTAANVTSSSSQSSRPLSSERNYQPALLAEAEDIYIECQFEDFFDG